MSVRNRILLVIAPLALCLGTVNLRAQRHGAASSSSAIRAVASGTVTGRVLDTRGAVQAGVPVTITRQDGLLVRKVYTTPAGKFTLSRLVPGLYAVDVSLPTFLPFSKSPIPIKAGAQVVVDVQLRTLAESMEIGMPADAAQARDDWKWTLRAASPARPILRFQEEIGLHQTAGASEPHQKPVRGSVFLTAGNEARGFGADPGVRTMFRMDYDWTGGNTAELAGSAGFERGTPAASFRAGWDHHSDLGMTSSLSVAMRQVFLPTAYRQQFSSPLLNLGNRVQSFSGRYEAEMPVGQNITLQYGAVFDSVTLNSFVSQWSPFAQISYTPDDNTRWTLAYSSEPPKFLPNNTATGGGAALLAIPQVSSDTNNRNHVALESGTHVEMGWDRKLGSRYRLQAAGFYDELSDAALSIGGGEHGGYIGALLRDPFSSSRFMDGGGYSSAGARASLGARLTTDTKLYVTYSYAGGLRAAADNLVAYDARTLRDMVETQRGSSVTVAVHSTLPGSRTEVTTSYQWLPSNTLVVGDPYNNGMARSEPYLNVAFIQPIPFPESFPGQFRAIADFSNLLAQGYVPVRNAEGATNYFFPAPRSFRGGFSFVF